MSGGPGAAALRSLPRGGGGGAAGAVGDRTVLRSGRPAGLGVRWDDGDPRPHLLRSGSPLQAARRGSGWASLGEPGRGEAALARKGVGVARGLGLRRRLGEPYGDATLNAKVGSFAFLRSLSPLSRRPQGVACPLSSSASARG